MTGTFFGESFLNRVSFLRENDEFLHQSWLHDSTQFLVFAGNDAYMVVGDTPELLLLGQESIKNFKQHITHKLFLGLKDFATCESDDGSCANGVLSYTARDADGAVTHVYQGRPIYALNVDEGTFAGLASDKAGLKNLQRINFQTVFTLSNRDASIYSQARMYLDWQRKYKFCPQCGQPVKFIQGGCKWVCTNGSGSGSGTSSDECPLSRAGGHNNVTFPRTDPVAIVALTNDDYSKICLVRTRRAFQNMKFYSCVAGFMEPGESVEAAAQREVWEETGVTCHDVSVVCSQPWPYPANLMVGCVAMVTFDGTSEVVSLKHDRELLDAQWFNTADIRDSIAQYKSGFALPIGNGMHIPGNIAVAFQLIQWICEKHAHLQSTP